MDPFLLVKSMPIYQSFSSSLWTICSCVGLRAVVAVESIISRLQSPRWIPETRKWSRARSQVDLNCSGKFNIQFLQEHLLVISRTRFMRPVFRSQSHTKKRSLRHPSLSSLPVTTSRWRACLHRRPPLFPLRTTPHPRMIPACTGFTNSVFWGCSV